MVSAISRRRGALSFCHVHPPLPGEHQPPHRATQHRQQRRPITGHHHRSDHHVIAVLGLTTEHSTAHRGGSGFHNSCRYNVDRDTPTTAATSESGAPSAIIFRACFAFTAVITVGRPPRRPRARAAASPA